MLVLCARVGLVKVKEQGYFHAKKEHKEERRSMGEKLRHSALELLSVRCYGAFKWGCSCT